MSIAHRPKLPLVRWQVFLAAVVASLLALGSLPARELQDLKTRFLNEAPQAWEDYRAFTERLDGSVSYRLTEQGKASLHYRFEFKHNNHCRLTSEQSLLEKDSQGELLAANPLYGFRLGRKDIHRPWVILDVASLEDENPSTYEPNKMADRTHLKQISIRPRRLELASLVRQPTFRVLQATAITQNGLDLVKIEFDNSHPLDQTVRPFVAVQGGSLVLDPAHSWCVHSCDLREKWLNSESNVSIAIAYQDASAKSLIPKLAKETDRSTHEEKGLRVHVFDWDFELSELVNLPPDSEFSLTAFGLPEPIGVEPHRSRWFIWTAVAGFACLGLGFMLRYRYRRAV